MRQNTGVYLCLLWKSCSVIFPTKSSSAIKPIANKVLELEPEMQKLTDEELQAKTPYLKEKLKNGASLDDILPEAFAVCREADCVCWA